MLDLAVLRDSLRSLIWSAQTPSVRCIARFFAASLLAAKATIDVFREAVTLQIDDKLVLVCFEKDVNGLQCWRRVIHFVYHETKTDQELLRLISVIISTANRIELQSVGRFYRRIRPYLRANKTIKEFSLDTYAKLTATDAAFFKSLLVEWQKCLHLLQIPDSQYRCRFGQEVALVKVLIVVYNEEFQSFSEFVDRFYLYVPQLELRFYGDVDSHGRMFRDLLNPRLAKKPFSSAYIWHVKKLTADFDMNFSRLLAIAHSDYSCARSTIVHPPLMTVVQQLYSFFPVLDELVVIFENFDREYFIADFDFVRNRLHECRQRVQHALLKLQHGLNVTVKVLFDAEFIARSIEQCVTEFKDFTYKTEDGLHVWSKCVSLSATKTFVWEMSRKEVRAQNPYEETESCESDSECPESEPEPEEVCVPTWKPENFEDVEDPWDGW